LFGYNAEKYYTLKNSYHPFKKLVFLQLTTPTTSKQIAINTMVDLKKVSVGFNIPEKNYKNYMDSFLRSNNFENMNNFKKKRNFLS
jgi:hypothetical protein